MFSKEANVFGLVKINNINYKVQNIVQLNDTESDCFLKFAFLQYIIYDNNFIFVLFCNHF